MSRRDLVILVVLLALWLAWPVIDRHFIKPVFFPSAPAPSPQGAEQQREEITPPVEAEGEVEPSADRTRGLALSERSETTGSAPASAASAKSEKILILENDLLRAEVSTFGGVIRSAVLKRYPLTQSPDSGPVVLDFADAPLLSMSETLTGPEAIFDVISADTTQIVLRSESPSALGWERRIRLDAGYLLTVEDVFANAAPESQAIPMREIWTGPMYNMEGQQERGVVYLGVDTLSPGERVQAWGGRFGKWFDQERKEKRLPKLPVHLKKDLGRTVDWVAAKNKYFVQIVIPEVGGEDALIRATRVVTEAERLDPRRGPRSATLHSVRAGIRLPELVLSSGGQQTWITRVYLGPKKYSELARYGFHLVDVMEFGMWAPIGKLLLRVLNALHDYVWPHNYGVAIMLLTIIIRLLFWPITHKSTESMKKLQALQPLLNELREKYKDDPQRLQQEMMALYREHKVNPLAGCLPMLVQFPVLIALFVVLRSAIELRFARFLWIRDLSQPENLLADVLPIPINILPIVMTITMAWQQKLTPGGGDPQQQKMMAFMPFLFLFMFYNFASGLVLYWTTNQILMIIQQLGMQRALKQPVGKLGQTPDQATGQKSRVQSKRGAT